MYYSYIPGYNDGKNKSHSKHPSRETPISVYEWDRKSKNYVLVPQISSWKDYKEQKRRCSGQSVWSEYDFHEEKRKFSSTGHLKLPRNTYYIDHDQYEAAYPHPRDEDLDYPYYPAIDPYQIHAKRRTYRSRGVDPYIYSSGNLHSSLKSPRPRVPPTRYAGSSLKTPHKLTFSLNTVLAIQLLNPVSFSFRRPIPTELAYSYANIPAFNSRTAPFRECRIRVDSEEFPKEWDIIISIDSRRIPSVHDISLEIWESLQLPVFGRRRIPVAVSDARLRRIAGDRYADERPLRVDWLKGTIIFTG
ncbi:hypothetical protein M422DRAFT_56209 [Sphaerobolus stellatus SS14]|uniref:DUF6699 domain-containing protein n=1 Tax=Sphaerobolus stellatus (strain SS14) TaxID=990650 RepID=A0A0C9U779_SPHS4|nr:hypothetical protein M422DRAFT_56209 [Sphaerobolus stellatus SS14]